MIHIIDVFGQFDSKGTGHYYTYPNGTLSANGIRAFLDPRSDLNGFNFTEAFALFCTATEGWWISIIKKNFHDPRQGYAMLSLCLGDQRPVNGAEAAQVLRQAFDHFVTNRTWDDAQSATWLQQLQTTPCAKTPFAGPTNLGTNSAYRTYSSEAELSQQLSYISQHGYEKFSRIFLISSAATTVPTATASRMHNVTKEIPVRQFFHFQVPNGVKISQPAGAFSGETIQITYTKGMLVSRPVSYVVGKMANEAYIDQQTSAIVINPAQPNVTFYKPIQIVAKSNTSGAGVNISPKTNFRGTNPWCFYDEVTRKYHVAEAAKGEIGTFTINGYHAYKLKAEELSRVQANGTYAIMLKARQVNAWVNINGSRHQLADAFNLQTANAYIKQHVATKCGSNDIEFTVDKSGTSGSNKDSILDIFFKVMGLIFTILLVIYMIYALACVCFSWDIWPFQQDNKQTTEQTSDDPNEPNEPTPADSTYTISDADIDYLKKNDTWDSHTLPNQPVKSLMDAIASGDVMSIISQHDAIFGTIDSSRINGHWRNIIEMLKGIQTDSEKMGKAKAEISRQCASGLIDLSKLQSALKTICKESQQQGEAKPAETKAASEHNDKEATKKKDSSKADNKDKSKSNKSSNSEKGTSETGKRLTVG